MFSSTTRNLRGYRALMVFFDHRPKAIDVGPEDLMMGLEQTFRESVLGETTSTVKELTGEAPRSLPEWLAENIGLLRN
jgi:hypothetical protein